jgi:hypothetical protein
MNGIDVLIGQQHGEPTGWEKAPRPTAVRVAPDLGTASAHQHGGASYLKAVDERITKKMRRVTATPEDRRKVGAIVRAMMEKVYTVERILEWRENHPLIRELRSSKWSGDRMDNAVDTLNAQYCDDDACRGYRLEGQVKQEVVSFAPGAKPPRALIMDKDVGQVMALLSVSCLEELTFGHFESESIKHCAKREAVERFASATRSAKVEREHGYVAVGGDGSSWDTTCSETVRNSIENPILEHISAVLHQNEPEVPEFWTREHTRVNKQKDLKIRVDERKIYRESVMVKIAAIRRSGHRGTSVLNWLTNKVLWSSVLAERPEVFVNPRQRTFKLRFSGKSAWVKTAYEGDDSAIVGSMNIREQEREMVECWHRWGFNMKLEWATPGQHFTFVGINFLLDSGGLTEVCMPELKRSFKTHVFTVSQEAIEGVVKGDATKAYLIGAASHAARASTFVHYPPIASYFLALSRGCLEAAGKRNTQLDRESQLRAFGEERACSVVALHADVEDGIRRAIAMPPRVADAYRLLVARQVGRTPTADQEAALLSVRSIHPDDHVVARSLVPKEWYD